MPRPSKKQKPKSNQVVDNGASITEKENAEITEKEPVGVYDFFELTEEDTPETITPKIEQKLGISLLQMLDSLSQSVISHAESLTLQFPNLAPLGDYGKLLENNDDMADFLKTEGHKPEHWKLSGIKLSNVRDDLFTFRFKNMGVDDGETFSGFVFVSKNGNIMHSFAQVEE